MFGPILEKIATELDRRVIAGRPRDLEDARQILYRTRALDHALIERWLKELGAALGSDFLGTLRSLLPPGR